MKPEIKFNVFVDKDLTECVAADPKWLQVFISAMDGLSLLQRYCLVYRVMLRSEPFLSASQIAMLSKYCDGLDIKHGSTKEAGLRLAIGRASRVQCVVEGLGQNAGVMVHVDFFRKGEKATILHLQLMWFMRDRHLLITMDPPFIFSPNAQPASF